MSVCMFDDNAEFRYETELRIRIRDLDHLKHVNNSMYATYMEQARADYFSEVLDIGLNELEIAVVSSRIEFKKQLKYGGCVVVQVRVPELGRTSFPFEYRFLDGEEEVATARTVQVALDSDADVARPLPDFWRETIAEYESILEDKEKKGE